MNSLKKIMLIGSLLTLLNPIYGADNVPYEERIEQELSQKDKISDLTLWTTLVTAAIATHIVCKVDFYYKNISDQFKNLKDKFNDNKNSEFKSYAKITTLGAIGAAIAILAYKNLNNITQIQFLKK